MLFMLPIVAFFYNKLVYRPIISRTTRSAGWLRRLKTKHNKGQFAYMKLQHHRITPPRRVHHRRRSSERER